MSRVSSFFPYFYFVLLFRILIMMHFSVGFFESPMLLNLLNLYVYSFHQIWKVFCYYVFEYFFNSTLSSSSKFLWYKNELFAFVPLVLQTVISVCFLSVVQIRWILLICPQIHCFYPLSSALSYWLPSSNFVFVVLFSFTISVWHFLTDISLLSFFFFPSVWREFVIACWKFLMMVVLKYLINNSNIKFISLLFFTDYFIFLIQLVIVLFLGMKSNFYLHSGNINSIKLKTVVPIFFKLAVPLVEAWHYSCWVFMLNFPLGSTNTTLKNVGNWLTPSCCLQLGECAYLCTGLTNLRERGIRWLTHTTLSCMIEL